MSMPPAPACAFASDNAAGAHPLVLEALVEANQGHALAYGEDRWTKRCEALFDEVFGQPVTTLLAVNGTGANVLALAGLLNQAEAVLCSDWSHINVDETGAPERVLGAKLIPLRSVAGRVDVAEVERACGALGNPHHAQPGVLSLTQSTEWGTCYTVDEIGALVEAAHARGLRVHLDGARIANAVAALGHGVGGLREMVVETGVDAISFGGTKNGLFGAEAVVFLNRDLAARGQYLRKQVNQLASKMRFISAQFCAALEDDRWLDWAGHANEMASELHRATAPLLPAGAIASPEVNSVFPVLPSEAAASLRDWCFFWDWDTTADQYRWMTAWDTTPDDISRFAAGVAHVLAR